MIVVYRVDGQIVRTANATHMQMMESWQASNGKRQDGGKEGGHSLKVVIAIVRRTFANTS